MQVVKQFATTISFLSKAVISEELLQQVPQGYVTLQESRCESEHP